VLGRVDAIVFTGGVGEKSFYVRDHVLRNMEDLGISIDLEKNDTNVIDNESRKRLSQEKLREITKRLRERAGQNGLK
jgi:acetate kinase